MQTILGAGGSIGLEMAKILPGYTDRVRLVGRNPARVNPEDEIYRADLLKPEAVAGAIRGSKVVYLVAGLPYKARVWEDQWPAIMGNVIDACRVSGSRLVFFDNVYMYDRDHLAAMDEDTPVRPTSRKGKVRAEIANQLMAATRQGDIQGLIARSADFYGPGKQPGSVLTQTVFERLAGGRPAQWLLSADCAHSFTYTPDAALGTVLLGNTSDAYGKVWHLPTAPNPPTGRTYVEMIAAELGVEPRIQVVKKPLLSVIGLFVPPLRELKEVAYQYDRDYDFRSDRFNQRFDFKPCDYREGIRTIVQADYGSGTGAKK